MCSRYYIDDHTLDEVSGLLVDRRSAGLKWTAGDVHPGEMAPIIMKKNTGLQLDEMKWGFPQYTGKGLFINARAETALQKKTFSESILHRRCVIPARHFYEWDASKNKVSFLRESGSVLYMAGFFNMMQDEIRFVILTTQANPSVLPVEDMPPHIRSAAGRADNNRSASRLVGAHDRMPLILEKDDVEKWILDSEQTQDFLQKIPVSLQRTQEYEQQSLFGMI
ncbi:MAG: SOS response-associated peptidase [Lachnospiraceae bacterium]|nr:SOS response-associated peptidase [Lachnospiraceae bacterium]